MNNTVTIDNDKLNELNKHIIDLLTWSSEVGIPTTVVFGMIDNIKFEHQYGTLMAAYRAANEANKPKLELVTP